jgi:hypothetical protein
LPIMGETTTPPDQSLSWFLRSLGVPARRGVPVSAAGKHRAARERSRWRRSSAQAVIPAQRRVGIDVVDAQTKVAHLVSPDELVAGHQRGDYVAFCGARFLAASLVEPGRGQCMECVR